MSTYQDYANAVGNILTHQGDVAARAKEQSGQVWGNTLATLGDVVPKEIQQVLKDRAAKQKTLKIQGIVQKYGGDIGKAAPEIMQVDPERGSALLGSWAKVQDSVAQLDKIKADAQDRTQKLSDELLMRIPLDDQAGPDAFAHWAIVAQKAGLNPPTQFDKDYVKTLQDQARAATTKTPEPYTLNEGAKRFGANNQLVAENPKLTAPKTKDEILFDSKNPNSPTQAISQQAWDLLQTAPSDSSGELKPVRVGGKMVFAVFDPKTKKLMYQGQDVTQTAEPPRDPLEAQAAAQAFQAAQQARSQSFTEAQAGRTQLEKINTTYHTAQSGVDTLRATIQAAAKGNVTAAAQQSLMTTMATLKAEGFNRINTAEIGSTKDAGSLVQNIEGWFGKKIEGQPIPASVQKDMLDYADILEKAAYHKYVADFNSAKGTYGLKTAMPETEPIPQGPSSQPPPPAPSAAPTPNLRPNLQRRLGGK